LPTGTTDPSGISCRIDGFAQIFFQVAAFGIRHSAFGIRHSAFGIPRVTIHYCMSTGDWRLAIGDWRLATGDWRLATGDWRLAFGDCRMPIAAARCTMSPVFGVVREPSGSAMSQPLLQQWGDLKRIAENYRLAVAEFVSHGHVFELRNHRRRVTFDLADLVLAGLLAGENILLVGSSGTGKTFLAQRALRGLFGETGYGVLNVTPGLDEDVLFDVDLSVQLKGGRLAQSILPGPLLAGWGLVIDDMYRAHPKLRNVLLAVVRAEPGERRISGKGGAQVPVGRPYIDGSGQRWFSVIATANPARAGEFTGNYEADQAETRRFALILNVDKYAPRAAQMGKLLRTAAPAPVATPPVAEPETVIRLSRAIAAVPVSEGAHLLAMLAAAHNRCEKTADGIKPWSRLPDFCSSDKVKCAVARNEGTICPYVGELPPAAVQDLIDVSRAVAALEWTAAIASGEDGPEIARGPEVRIAHVRAVLPLVAQSKVWLHRRYYEDPDKFNGDQEAALRKVADAMQQEVTDFKYRNEELVTSVMGGAGQTAGKNVREQLQRWARSRSPALADVIASLLGIDLREEPKP